MTWQGGVRHDIAGQGEVQLVVRPLAPCGMEAGVACFGECTCSQEQAQAACSRKHMAGLNEPRA